MPAIGTNRTWCGVRGESAFGGIGEGAGKTGQPAAELVERRAGAEGNVSQQSTGRAQYRGTVSQALKRIRHFVRISRRAVTHPRWEPYARIGLVRICAGGAR